MHMTDAVLDGVGLPGRHWAAAARAAVYLIFSVSAVQGTDFDKRKALSKYVPSEQIRSF